VIRRLVGTLTLAAIVSASAASHHHAVLASDSDLGTEVVVTRHNPFSSASHWHAILKIFPLDPCWACHWSRVFGLWSNGASGPVRLAIGRLNALPPRSAISIARFTRRSRAPPSLRSL
jgi:hypothetical protein